MNIRVLKNNQHVNIFSLKYCRISYHNLKNQQHGNKESKESSSKKESCRKETCSEEESFEEEIGLKGLRKGPFLFLLFCFML
jgi:hypothetical protein